MAVIRGSSIGIRRVVARLFGGPRIISRATPVCMTGAAPTHAAKKGTINLDIVNSLSKAFRQASETEEVKEVLKRLSYPHDIKESEELIQIIKKDYELNGKLFKELGLGMYKKD